MKVRPALLTLRAAGSLFRKKKLVGTRVRLDQFITPISSAAGSQFMEAVMCPSNPQVMVVFAYRCSRLAK